MGDAPQDRSSGSGDTLWYAHAGNRRHCRLESIPEAYWGSWAPDASGCNEPTQRIVLSAKAYVGPQANCRIVSVSETPSQNGSTYSARLECLPKGVSNLIIQPKSKDTVLSGHDLQSLKPYQRCPRPRQPAQNLACHSEAQCCRRRPRSDLISRWKRASQNGSDMHGRLGPSYAYEQGGVAYHLSTCRRRAGTFRDRKPVLGHPAYD